MKGRETIRQRLTKHLQTTAVTEQNFTLMVIKYVF